MFAAIENKETDESLTYKKFISCVQSNKCECMLHNLRGNVFNVFSTKLLLTFRRNRIFYSHLDEVLGRQINLHMGTANANFYTVLIEGILILSIRVGLIEILM